MLESFINDLCELISEGERFDVSGVEEHADGENGERVLMLHGPAGERVMLRLTALPVEHQAEAGGVK